MKRWIIKLAKYFILPLLVLTLVAYFWVKGLWKDAISSEEWNKLMQEVETFEKLPDSFLATTEALSPNIFSETYIEYSLSQSFSKREFRICPCRNNTYFIASPRNRPYSINISHWTKLSLTWKLEKEWGQMKCFEYLMQKYDFLYGQIGVRKASNYYLKKELEDLDLEGRLELLAMLENPVLYNGNKHPDRLAAKIEKLRELMEKNNSD